MGVGLVPCLGRRWNEEGVAGCSATWATTAGARRLWAARTAEGALRTGGWRRGMSNVGATADKLGRATSGPVASSGV
jgi:hypothetical protein